MATAAQQAADDLPRHPLEQDPWIAYALNRIALDYGDRCIANRLDVNKYGENEEVGTAEVSVNSWNGDEVYQTSNIILNLASDVEGDAGKTMDIAYMDLTDDIFTLGVMTVSLHATDARIIVPLPTAAARWTRMVSTTDMLGHCSIFRGTATLGVPTDNDSIHNQIHVGAAESHNCATTIPHDRHALLLHIWADLVRKSATDASISLLVRNYGENFHVLEKAGCSSNHDYDHAYKSPRIIKGGSDILIKAKSTAASTEITAGYQLVIADIMGPA